MRYTARLIVRRQDFHSACMEYRASHRMEDGTYSGSLQSTEHRVQSTECRVQGAGYAEEPCLDHQQGNDSYTLQGITN